METTIHITGEKAVRVLGAVCLATGMVALSAVAASGAAVGAVAVGFRSAKNAMQKILKNEETAAEESNETVSTEGE